MLLSSFNSYIKARVLETDSKLMERNLMVLDMKDSSSVPVGDILAG